MSKRVGFTVDFDFTNQSSNSFADLSAYLVFVQVISSALDIGVMYYV